MFFRRGAVHQLFEDPLEAGERVGSMAADLLDEGGDDRAAPTGVLAPDEHPIFVTTLGRADGVFREIVVELLKNSCQNGQESQLHDIWI